MNQHLQKTPWAAADKLRSDMDAAECKHVVLGQFASAEGKKGRDGDKLRGDRGFCALEQPHRPFLTRFPQFHGFGIDPLAHPGTGWDFRQTKGFLEEAIRAEGFDGVEVALAQTEAWMAE